MDENFKEDVENILINDFVAELKKQAPINTNKHKHKAGESHLKDSIRRIEENQIEMNYYAKYVNDGTSKMPGCYFIDIAYDNILKKNKDFVYNKAFVEIGKALKKK